MNIPQTELKDFIKLCEVPSHGNNEKFMFLHIHSFLTSLDLPYAMDGMGNILVTKGKSKFYPCVVAHMDTVHTICNMTVVYDKKNKILSSPTGIGGDDKCGIYSCFYLLKTLPAIKIVFFSREETGCKGSNYIDLEFFQDCRYILQLDRQNASDFIDKYCGDKTISHNFASEVGDIKKKYKFKSATGTVTDCMTLWNRKVGLSCVNISSGYYEPHTINEYIDINGFWNSVLFAKEIINTLKVKPYTSLPPKKVYTTAKNYSTKKYCTVCCTWKPESTGYYKKGKFICWSCNWEGRNKDTTSQYVKCISCGWYFKRKKLTWIEEQKGWLCNKCKKEQKITETAITKPISDYKMCSMCYKWVDSKDGIVINNSFICYSCNEGNKFNNLEEKEDKITGVDICSVCSRTSDINKGKYFSNEFLCRECLKDYERKAMVKCTRCHKEISDSLGILHKDNWYCIDCIKKTAFCTRCGEIVAKKDCYLCDIENDNIICNECHTKEVALKKQIKAHNTKVLNTVKKKKEENK